MSLVYYFQFPIEAAGLAAVVKNSATGSAVTGSPVTLDANGLGALSLDQSELYVATASNTALGLGNMTVQGVLDVPASIEAGGSGGGGAADQAHFIGTSTADTSGDDFPVTWIQDPAYDPVDWATVVGGNIEVTAPIIVGFVGRQGGNLDCSGAAGFSTANQAVIIEGFLRVLANGETGEGTSYATFDYLVPVGASGDVFEIDAPSNNASDATAWESMTITGSNDAYAYDASGQPVTDGVLNSITALTITRREMPALPTLS